MRCNTLAPWRTTSTIQAYGDHHFLHLDTNPVICHALVHSVDKTHVLVVTVDLIWLLFLNILSFNFVATPRKSLRFTRIIRSYAVVLTNNYQSYTAFLLYVCCSKLPCSIFLQLFIPNDSAFALLSTPVARTEGSADEQMWNSYKYIKFNSWRVKHSIDRRTTLSPNFQSVEEETFECLLILQL